MHIAMSVYDCDLNVCFGTTPSLPTLEDLESARQYLSSVVERVQWLLEKRSYGHWCDEPYATLASEAFRRLEHARSVALDPMLDHPIHGQAVKGGIQNVLEKLDDLRSKAKSLKKEVRGFILALHIWRVVFYLIPLFLLFIVVVPIKLATPEGLGMYASKITPFLFGVFWGLLNDYLKDKIKEETKKKETTAWIERAMALVRKVMGESILPFVPPSPPPPSHRDHLASPRGVSRAPRLSNII